jgi:hypothetical protein
MLSDPVSAQEEEGGCIFIFITGVTCEENEIEDCVFLMSFSLILSVKMISNFLVPTLRPDRQPLIAVFPPAGFVGSAAAFC